MKSWKARFGLVLTMLAMLLAVSIPAIAHDDDDNSFENRLELLEDRFDDLDFDDEDLFGDDLSLEVDDVQFFCGDDDGDGLVGEDVVDGIDEDLDGLFDEDEELVGCDDLFAVVQFDNDFDGFDFDGDGLDLDLD